MSQGGSDPKVLGIFFKEVMQAVLIFGADTWVLTPRMEWALSSFQHRFAQRLTGRQTRRHPSQILKRRQGLQRLPVGLKGLLQTLRSYSSTIRIRLLFRSIGALGGGKVPPVQSTPGHYHVSVGVQWVGEVSLLQNDNSIMDMPVEKVYPHFHPRRRSSRISLNWTFPQSPCSREGQPLCSRLLAEGCGFPTPSPLFCPPMLSLHVSRQRPKHHILPALLALDMTPLSLPVQRARSHNTSTICRLQLRPYFLEWAVDGSECLPDVSLQDHPAE